MVRRKQARPSRPGGAADLLNDDNLEEIIEGELAVAARGAGTSNGLEARAGIQNSEATPQLAEEGKFCQVLSSYINLGHFHESGVPGVRRYRRSFL